MIDIKSKRYLNFVKIIRNLEKHGYIKTVPKVRQNFHLGFIERKGYWEFIGTDEGKITICVSDKYDDFYVHKIKEKLDGMGYYSEIDEYNNLVISLEDSLFDKCFEV